MNFLFFFFFQAEDGIRDVAVTGVQTCALPISPGETLWRVVVERAVPDAPPPVSAGPSSALPRTPPLRHGSARAAQGLRQTSWPCTYGCIAPGCARRPSTLDSSALPSQCQ